MTRQRFDEHLACLRPYFDELGVDPPAYPERFEQRFDEQVRALLETGPPVFSFVFGDPPADVLGERRQRGIVTVGTATKPDEAVALDEAGVDMIVASGFEAGGHRGSFIESAQASLTGTMALVPVVADEVRAPVVAWPGEAIFTPFVVSPALKAMKWTETERVLVRPTRIGKQNARAISANLVLLQDRLQGFHPCEADGSAAERRPSRLLLYADRCRARYRRGQGLLERRGGRCVGGATGGKVPGR